MSAVITKLPPGPIVPPQVSCAAAGDQVKARMAAESSGPTNIVRGGGVIIVGTSFLECRRISRQSGSTYPANDRRWWAGGVVLPSFEALLSRPPTPRWPRDLLIASAIA